MKILLTGATGFLGRNISGHFSDLDITPLNSKSLNLTNQAEVNSFFKGSGGFDTVIHCAIKGGKRTDVESMQTYFDNVDMALNIMDNKKYFNNLINFCSGAAYSRKFDILNSPESIIKYKYPTDFYGMAKGAIAKQVNRRGYYNLRIFACFNNNEPDSRFIKTCIRNIKNKEPIEIQEDKYFDFFYAKDVNIVIEKILKDDPLPHKDINLSYNNKLKLSELAIIISKKMGVKPNVVIFNEQGLNYTGAPDRLYELGLPLTGLDKALDEYIANEH